MEAIKVTAVTPTLVESPKTLSELHPLTMPQGGRDRLNFDTWDTIEVFGQEDTFHLHGYYVIERADPTSADWYDASVEISMRELSVTGVSQKFGRVYASVNHGIGRQSRGRVSAGTNPPEIVDSPIFDAPKLCTMDGFMKFELPDVGMTVFNKEPIVLKHNITHIPPIAQGGGTGRVAVNLHRIDDPDGPPIAILREVKTNIGAWLED